MNAFGKQNKIQQDCLKQLGAVGISGYALSSLTMAPFIGDSPRWPIRHNILWLITL